MFQTAQIGEANYFLIGCSTKCLSMSCTSSDIISSINFGSIFMFKYHQRKVRLSFILICLFCHNISCEFYVQNSNMFVAKHDAAASFWVVPEV